MTETLAAIIVSHNSATVLPRCLGHLARQTLPVDATVVVDSGSSSREYLAASVKEYGVTLAETENVGFSRANNLGCRHLAGIPDWLVFLNPDTFLPVDYLEKAVNILKDDPGAAMVSGVLCGCDPDTGNGTGRVDSTGVFRRWYGRWYDRDQGCEVGEEQAGSEYLPAVCGALMCCRTAALAPYFPDVFDPDFFLYKEDIELSLRLRRDGWNLLFDSTLRALHCRGWTGGRRRVSRSMRQAAARSEVLLYKKHPSLYMSWALMKYGLVQWFDL